MSEIIKPPDKTYQIRCPRLGHQIYFTYCRSENQGLPCFKTLDCWWQHFNVDAYLQTELTDDEWQQCFQRKTKPKMVSLVEIIEKAKKAARGENEDE